MSLFSGNNIVYLGLLIVYGTFRHQQINNAIIDSHTKNIRIFEGYKILSCYQIRIYDEKRAFRFAFNIGKNEIIDKLYDKLFGSYDCFSKLDKEHVATMKFAYNLIFIGLCGQLSAGKIDMPIVEKILKSLKDNIEEETDIDTSEWLREKDIGTIIKEFNK